MGKRSDFERNERDFYPTPIEAVEPLFPHLREGTVFWEPCAGNGILVKILERKGHRCSFAGDIEPQDEIVARQDALTTSSLFGLPDCIITNPPWARPTLHRLIAHLSDIAPTWLLFDADWMHTKQAIPYLPRLQKIVSVGRVKWIPNSSMTGKDNCCWYLFAGANIAAFPPMFFGRR